MCGIAGMMNIYENNGVSIDTLKRMAAIIKHRGPDGYGFYKDERVGFAHARLSIIDLEGGWQPIHNEDKTVWITFNGEIFNYIELREFLLRKGHKFYTQSDTEVIVHLYEDYGEECLGHLNGQFSFAIWDKKNEVLFMARDRVGIRPLFYTTVDNTIIFASEIKSIFMDKRVNRDIDIYGLDQTFTYWMPLSPRTVFKNIFEIPAGHFLSVNKGEMKITKYWDIDFTIEPTTKSESHYSEEFLELLIDATKLQLRSDVPVGAYLSGGIDSSSIASIIKNFTDTNLKTFSISFYDEVYDESIYQLKMIDYLKTDHVDIKCAYSDIGRSFPEAIWHIEKPILRTAPVPLFLLSKLVKNNGYKVVLTGEGADEFLAGYDIFKETKVRRFIEKFPDSEIRPLILKKLYPYLANSPSRSLQYAKKFFNIKTSKYEQQFYSHLPRWNSTSKIRNFFSDDLKTALDDNQKAEELSKLLPAEFLSNDYLSRSQYIEIKTLLSGYLLSSQGDRVAMANSIEARYPFLDHRIMEFCTKIPPNTRMKTINEKHLLKKSMSKLLPSSIINRTKQPYMAPDAKSFFTGDHLEYIDNILSYNNLRDSGLFNPDAVSVLHNKCMKNSLLGFSDNMAIVGIVSTLLLKKMFIDDFTASAKRAIENIEGSINGKKT